MITRLDIMMTIRVAITMMTIAVEVLEGTKEREVIEVLEALEGDQG